MDKYFIQVNKYEFNLDDPSLQNEGEDGTCRIASGLKLIIAILPQISNLQNIFTNKNPQRCLEVLQQMSTMLNGCFCTRFQS